MRTIDQMLTGLRVLACDDRLGDGMLLHEAADIIDALRAENALFRRALALLAPGSDYAPASLRHDDPIDDRMRLVSDDE